MHPMIYDNLLYTMSLRPKKKHMKKLVKFLIDHENSQNITPELINNLIDFGIENKYPIVLGKFVRDLIVQKDAAIHK